ncbi:Mesencephalic astrocyte-derived neurotrophic factor, partial [Ophiophagus hannah]
MKQLDCTCFYYVNCFEELQQQTLLDRLKEDLSQGNVFGSHYLLGYDDKMIGARGIQGEVWRKTAGNRWSDFTVLIITTQYPSQWIHEQEKIGPKKLFDPAPHALHFAETAILCKRETTKYVLSFLGMQYCAPLEKEVEFTANKAKDTHFCHYTTAISDAASQINEVLKLLRHHVLVEKLKKNIKQICKLNYDKETDLLATESKNQKFRK